MNSYITSIERYVLESIQKSAKSIFDLVLDTKLEPKILKSVLFNLQNEKYITVRKERYFLNEKRIEDLKIILKDRMTSTLEISHIIKSNIHESLINDKKECFQFKKISLNKEEEVILNSMLLNIESFLESIQSKKGKTSDEKIVFWGMNSYINTINSLL